ncbi:hypothetical protein R50073_13060 [Maricurvus nonylphenolicus]|uniref:DUF7133 domain-containing protein n=1 Tax=Maricurvus nonylphenolicus TaxID=1008307 RepID=UPI0036F1C756
MKKFILVCVLVIAAIPAYLLLSGTISVTSFAMILNVMAGKGIETPSDEVIENRIQVADGFGLSLYASDLPNARFIAMTANRDLLVSRPHKGEVVMIRANRDDASVGGERVTLLEGLNKPSGIVVAEGWLFVGESDAIGRIVFDETTGTTSGSYERILEGLTGDGNHPYKQIKRGPDGKIYLSQGSTCNVCIEADSRRGTMGRFDLDGKNFEVIATGLRNTMGFDWTPWNGDLYGTDNGRDLLGDDYPPCELNLIQQGKFYGWPYFNGANEADPDFNPDSAPAELVANPVAPVHEFRAHNAPLGMTFIDAEGWPEDFQQSALVALHGSWNRSIPDGYRVVSLHWNDGKIERRDFLAGFELDGDVIGRPVDITQGPDGAVYISDDYAGAIYRMAYGEEQKLLGTAKAEEETPFELQQPTWLTADNTATYKAAGQQLYDKFHCQSCHNPAYARGNMNLTDANQRLQYADVIERLTKPRAPMPVFPLSEADKQALAVWLLDQ